MDKKPIFLNLANDEILQLKSTMVTFYQFFLCLTMSKFNILNPLIYISSDNTGQQTSQKELNVLISNINISMLSN